MTEFERFEFRPWMGYTAGLLLSVVGWGVRSELGIFARALGFTLIFGTNARSHHLYRRRTGAGASAGELRSVLFAGLSGLVALGVLVAYLYGLWATHYGG